jgi:hypothetical protein
MCQCDKKKKGSSSHFKWSVPDSDRMWKNTQAENYGLCKWQNQISNKRELEDTGVIQGKIRKWVEQKRM